MRLRFVTLLVVLLASASCETVKPYQRAWLNDREMQEGTTGEARFESYAEAIREGASKPVQGKGSGGCGCN